MQQSVWRWEGSAMVAQRELARVSWWGSEGIEKVEAGGP
jgi:hypothetical protein